MGAGPLAGDDGVAGTPRAANLLAAAEPVVEEEGLSPPALSLGGALAAALRNLEGAVRKFMELSLGLGADPGGGVAFISVGGVAFRSSVVEAFGEDATAAQLSDSDDASEPPVSADDALFIESVLETATPWFAAAPSRAAIALDPTPSSPATTGFFCGTGR